MKTYILLLSCMITCFSWSQEPLIIHHNGKQTAVSANGKALLPAWYTTVDPINDDAFIVSEPSGTGVYSTGKLIIPLKYDVVHANQKKQQVYGYFVAKSNKWAYFDATGKQLTDFSFSRIITYSLSKSSLLKKIPDNLIQCSTGKMRGLYLEEKNGTLTRITKDSADYWSDANGFFVAHRGNTVTLYAFDPVNRELKLVRPAAAGGYEFRQKHYYFMNENDEMKQFTYAHKLVFSGKYDWDIIQKDPQLASDYEDNVAMEVSEGSNYTPLNHAWLYDKGKERFDRETNSILNQGKLVKQQLVEFIQSYPGITTTTTGKNLICIIPGEREPLIYNKKNAFVIGHNLPYIAVKTDGTWQIHLAGREVLLKKKYSKIACIYPADSLPIIACTIENGNYTEYYTVKNKDWELRYITIIPTKNGGFTAQNDQWMFHYTAGGKSQTATFWASGNYYSNDLDFVYSDLCDSVVEHEQLNGIWYSYEDGKRGIEIPGLNRFSLRPEAGTMTTGLHYDMPLDEMRAYSMNISLHLLITSDTAVHIHWFNKNYHEWYHTKIDKHGYRTAYMMDDGLTIVAELPDGWCHLYDRGGNQLFPFEVQLAAENRFLSSEENDIPLLIAKTREGKHVALRPGKKQVYEVPSPGN